MTRSVRAHEYAEKRNAILGVAQRYIVTTAYPDQAARTILALLVEEGKQIDIPRLVQIGEATADALERVLGISPGCLRHSWSEDLSRWQALLA